MTKLTPRNKKLLAELPIQTSINKPYQKLIKNEDGTEDIWWCSDLKDYSTLTETTYTFEMIWRNIKGEEVIYKHQSIHPSKPVENNVNTKRLALVKGKCFDDNFKNSPHEVGCSFASTLPYLERTSSLIVQTAPITTIPIVRADQVLIEDELNQREKGFIELLRGERALDCINRSFNYDGHRADFNFFSDREELELLFDLNDRDHLPKEIGNIVDDFLTTECSNLHQYYQYWKDHNRWLKMSFQN